MPLVEFMLHAVPNGKSQKSKIPDFIRGSADFYNPADDTYVGWVADNRDFYLPDTITVLTKQTFAERLVAMHQDNPMRKESTVNDQGETVEGDEMTDEEVTNYANDRYDYIVNHCKTEEGSI